MDADFTVKQGDSTPVFTDTLSYSDGSPANLVGALVSFAMQDIRGTTPVALTGQVSVTSPSTGGVQYSPTPADTAVSGTYMANWVVLFGVAQSFGDLVAGSAVISNLADLTYFTPGTPLFGTGVPLGAVIASNDGDDEATMSLPATRTGHFQVTSAQQMTFPTDGYLWVEVQPSLAGQAGMTDNTQRNIAFSEMIRPSVETLASLCRARTSARGSGGAETGAFGPLTRPTYDEAENLISTALTAVMTSVGFDMPDWAVSDARQLVLFRAAQLVEATFYPLAVSKGESPYAVWKELYDEGLIALTNAIEGDVGGAPRQAVYSVPVMTIRQARYKEFGEAIASGDWSGLPDDMRYPMGPKGVPFTVPSGLDDWGGFDWDAWMEFSR